MDFIEPLALGTWFESVLAGTPDILVAVALLLIFGLAGYFRMNMLATFFMIGLFLLMFSGTLASPLLVLVFIIGGLVLGLTFSRITP